MYFKCTVLISIAVLLQVASTFATDPCLLTPKVGPCKALIPRYYFDHKTNKCTKFYWGGCHGQVPFKTLEECKKDKCPTKPCVQKPDMGPCEAAITKWFFNKMTMTCEPFIWGGCHGKVPFDTLKDCVKAQCKPPKTPSPSPTASVSTTPSSSVSATPSSSVSPTPSSSVSPTPSSSVSPSPSTPKKPKCFLKPSDVLPKLKPGQVTCPTFFKSWYFDRHSKTCKSFTYSGCSNVGPFRTEKGCESECLLKK